MRISQRTVQAAPIPAKGYIIYWDDEIRGFGLRVTSGGARSFVVQGRIKRKLYRPTIGRWPAFKAEQARKDAKAWLGAVSSGRDPVAESRRHRQAERTLEEAFKDYMELKRRAKDGLPLKQSTKDDMTRVLEESLDDWKSKYLPSITRPMVEQRYKKLADKSVARASIAMRYLRAVFNFEIDRNVDADGKPFITDNPVGVLKKQWRRVKRRRRVLQPEQLPEWVSAVNGLAVVPDREKGTGRRFPKLRHGDVYRDWLFFMALTGCRPIEARELKPENVDLVRRTFFFDDTKNRTDHELPMTDFLYDLLARRLAVGGERVFCSPHDLSPVTNYRYAVSRVKAACGTHFSPGDMRRLASTAMEAAGVPAYTIKAILNHAISDGDDVTGGYVVVSLQMKLAALKKIEAYVLRRRKVVPFPGAKAA